MKGFNLPVFLGKATPEKIAELDIRAAQDKVYTLSREKKIRDRWKKLNSSTRRVADFIQNNFLREISYKEMSKELGIKESVLKMLVADLNFWTEFGYRMKRVKGKKGYVQSIKKDLADTEDYLKKKARTIASMEQVYGNISDDIKIKRKKKVKVSQKVKAKKR